MGEASDPLNFEGSWRADIDRESRIASPAFSCMVLDRGGGHLIAPRELPERPSTIACSSKSGSFERFGPASSRILSWHIA